MKYYCLPRTKCYPKFPGGKGIKPDKHMSYIICLILNKLELQIKGKFEREVIFKNR